MNQWYAFYCRSRHEKKAAEKLLKNGLDVFLPLQTIIRQWSDRKKKVEEPLFKGYLFVHCTEKELYRVCAVPGIVAPVKIVGRYGFLRPEEKEGIERLLATGVYAEAVETDWKKGDRVQITEGLMKGLQGTCISESGFDYFLLEIDSLKLSLRVRIPAATLKKI